MARDKQQEQEQGPPTERSPFAPQESGANQPKGDYSQGHPGVPPKNYEQPKERR